MKPALTLAEPVSAADAILQALRERRLDYREANPTGDISGPWRARCPVCRLHTNPDDRPLSVGRDGSLRCGNDCDPDKIAEFLVDSPVTLAAPAEEWLSGSPMDPTASSPEPMPAIAGIPFLHPGAGAVVVGPTGAGRSSLVEAAFLDAGLAGVRCGYLGSEITEAEFNARARMLADVRGLTVDDELLARLASVRYLDLASVIARAWLEPDVWAAGINDRFDVIAIDPLSAVASALDLDFDQRNAEFIAFYDRLIQPLTNAGVAVLMLDNVGHALEAKQRAKGVSAKQDRADLTFSCAISAHPTGLIVRAHKVRTIRASFQRGAEWIFERETQRIDEHAIAADHDGAEHFRPTTLMQRVSEKLQEQPGLGIKAIRREVRGKNQFIDDALRALITEEYVEKRESGHYSLRAFIADTDEAERCPEGAPQPVPQVPPVPHTVPQPCPVPDEQACPGAYKTESVGHRHDADAKP